MSPQMGLAVNWLKSISKESLNIESEVQSVLDFLYRREISSDFTTHWADLIRKE